MKKLILVGLLVLILPGLCLAQGGSAPLSNLVICRSAKVITNPIKPMKCDSGPVFEANLKSLLENGFHIVQVIKAEKEYVYYLEKEKKRVIPKEWKEKKEKEEGKEEGKEKIKD